MKIKAIVFTVSMVLFSQVFAESSQPTDRERALPYVGTSEDRESGGLFTLAAQEAPKTKKSLDKASK